MRPPVAGRLASRMHDAVRGRGSSQFVHASRSPRKLESKGMLEGLRAAQTLERRPGSTCTADAAGFAVLCNAICINGSALRRQALPPTAACRRRRGRRRRRRRRCSTILLTCCHARCPLVQASPAAVGLLLKFGDAAHEAAFRRHFHRRSVRHCMLAAALWRCTSCARCSQRVQACGGLQPRPPLITVLTTLCSCFCSHLASDALSLTVGGVLIWLVALRPLLARNWWPAAATLAEGAVVGLLGWLARQRSPAFLRHRSLVIAATYCTHFLVGAAAGWPVAASLDASQGLCMRSQHGSRASRCPHRPRAPPAGQQRPCARDRRARLPWAGHVLAARAQP